MSTFGENQLRKMFIANAVHSAVRSTPGDLEEGEVQAFQADGVGAPTAGDRFYIASLVDGIIQTSEIIDPTKVIYNGEKTFTPKLPSWTITLGGTPTSDTGKVVDVVLAVENYGAGNSTSEPYYLHASHVIVASDTVDLVGAGIVATGNYAAEKSGIPVTFAYNASTNVLSVTTTRTPFALGKFAGEPLKATIVCKTEDTGVTAVIADVSVDATDNGKEIANIEWFDLGNTGDIYRGMGYPNNIDSSYVAVTTDNYSVYELAYFTERTSAPGDKQRATLSIAINDSLDNTNAGVQITAPIDAAIG